MGLDAITQDIVAQGPVFWAAAAAIAAGLTLLAISLVVQVRRLSGRTKVIRWPGMNPLRRRSTPGRGAPEAAIQAAHLAAAAYEEAQAAATATVGTRSEATNETLTALLGRLRKASARLETVQERRTASAQAEGLSTLKGSAEQVEYVFRSGI